MRRLVNPIKRVFVDAREKYVQPYAFVHINKTGGSSVERALGIRFQHKTARELREILGDERWGKAFTFAFVRNPWDRVVSHYAFRIKTNQTGLGTNTIGFDEWVTRVFLDRDPAYLDKPKMFMPQVEWLADNKGAIDVDFVGRFERLQEDFEEICRRLGKTASLPHTKRSAREGYQTYYNDDTSRIVGDYFAEDLKQFGYEF